MLHDEPNEFFTEFQEQLNKWEMYGDNHAIIIMQQAAGKEEFSDFLFFSSSFEGS